MLFDFWSQLATSENMSQQWTNNWGQLTLFSNNDKYRLRMIGVRWNSKHRITLHFLGSLESQLIVKVTCCSLLLVCNAKHLLNLDFWRMSVISLGTVTGSPTYNMITHFTLRFNSQWNGKNFVYFQFTHVERRFFRSFYCALLIPFNSQWKSKKLSVSSFA